MDKLAGVESLLNKGLSVEAIQQLSQVSEESSTSHQLRGLALAQIGRSAEASQEFAHALSLDPRDVISHVGLAKYFLAAGDLARASFHAAQILEFSGADPDLIRFAGQTLEKTGHIEAACEAFKVLVSLAPRHLEDKRLLAEALSRAGAEADALLTWQSYLRLQPSDLEVQLKVCRLQMMGGLFEEAQRSAEAILIKDPQNIQALMFQALAAGEIGQTTVAETAIKKVLASDPNHGIALASLGFLLQEEGRFVEAQSYLERSLVVQPNHGFAYFNLFRGRKTNESDRNLLSAVEERAADPNISLLDRGYMHYALGKGYEDLSEFEKAITHFDTANSFAYQTWLTKIPWDKEAYAEDFRLKREYFVRQQFEKTASKGNPAELPVFVVGMIRSGTSLVEQILSSHPQVGGGGEQSFWHKRETEVFHDGSLDQKKVSMAAEQYLRLLKRLAPGKKRVTDKLPHNFAMIGQIACAFPRAKFIHIRRNPIDCALSIWTTAFQRPPGYAHDKGNIRFAFEQYWLLMEHWRSALPQGTMLEVRYEDLVADRESVTREMINFLGIPWDDACLSHESNARAVRTPSLWQVRQPLYKTSVERWRRYEPWLGEFSSLVEP